MTCEGDIGWNHALPQVTTEISTDRRSGHDLNVLPTRKVRTVVDIRAGHVAVVTGGASGIGLALARAFLGENMNVVIADIEEDAITERARRPWWS